MGKLSDDKAAHDSEDWSDDVESDEDPSSRGNWSRKLDFILSCLSYAVGLGNVWRFPYICYKNGGGAFLIPFFIMLFITGIPLVFLELSFGQFASSGVVSIWSVSPIFQGVGWAMFIVSCLIAVYYSMIIAWTVYYFFASFSSELPWSKCGDWSTKACMEDQSVYSNCTFHNGTWYNNTCVNPTDHNASYYSYIKTLVNETGITYKSSSDEYFHKVVLDISGSVNVMGGLRWELAGSLLVAWILVCVCLSKGIKTSGKAVYFTAFFPYVVLTILFIRGLLLEGSGVGIRYFLTPQWGALLDPKIWKESAVQIFFSLSPAWGGLITLASYNKFNNNTLKDAVLVSVLDCLTSVYGGLVIFAIIGYMANVLHQSVDSVASDGPGLAFVAYPYVVTKLPLSQLWAVLFFAMLITLGLGTQIATVTTVHTTLIDQFPKVFCNGKRSFCLLMVIASSCFLLGLSFCTQGGMYVVQIFDNYAATYSLLVIGMVEMIALGWIYGADRFLGDIELMLGRRPQKFWAYSWKFVAPISIVAILIFSIVDFHPSKYEDYEFPRWADGVGSILALMSIMAIPIGAIIKFVLAYQASVNQTPWEVLRELSVPTESWGPRIQKHKAMMAMTDSNGATVKNGQAQAMMTNGGHDDGYC